MWMKYIHTGPPRGGGQLGHFALGPLCLWAPKDQCTLIEQSKYSIKAVTTYICPGPLELSRLPCIHMALHSIITYVCIAKI